MTSMPCSALSLSLLIAGLGAQVADDSQPRRVLSEATRTLMIETNGQHPYKDLRAWARKSEGWEQHKWIESVSGPLAKVREEALVCALWADDSDTCYAAACNMTESALDLRDIDRWIEVVTPHIWDEEARYDWSLLKHILSTSGVQRILTPGLVWKADIRSFFITDLHRSFRPEHIPALCQLIHHDDPIIRSQAFETLSTLCWYTSKYRDQVGIELLKWPGPASFVIVDYNDPNTNPKYAPRPVSLPRATAGYPPLLRACLQRWFVDMNSSDRDARRYDPFLLRWMEDESPGADDRDTLCKMIASPHTKRRMVALRAIRSIPSDATIRKALEIHAENVATDERALNLAAAGNTTELFALARTDESALATALELDPETAFSDWAKLAFGPDTTLGIDAIKRLEEARELSWWGPFRFSTDIEARLREAIDQKTSVIDDSRLEQLARIFPNCTTKRQADKLTEELSPSQFLSSKLTPMLEVHDRRAFSLKLKPWASDPASPAHELALTILLELGDTDLENQALVLARTSEEEGDLKVLARAARSAHYKNLRKWFEHALRSKTASDGLEALAAVAVTRGIPTRTAWNWVDRLESVDLPTRRAKWDTWVNQMITGDPIEAILATLQTLPIVEQCIPRLGLIKDPRVQAAIRRVRNTPGVDVQQAIGELALAGDEEARKQLEQMRTRHLYGWPDSGDSEALSLGRSLELMPYWIAEIETICCRRNGASEIIGSLTEFDVFAASETGHQTQHDVAKRWWSTARDHLRWSRIAKLFVIAPR